MEIRDLALPAINKFASDYIDGRLKTDKFFHYDIHDEKVYEKRYSDLMNRSFHRTELAGHIRQYMDPFGMNDCVLRNLEALEGPDSAVVIGGQQAGLLSGPLYTIHKAISVIKLAEQQEKALKKRVIPVFWIAGEDHDIQEVNHIYAMRNGKPDKMSYPMYVAKKPMVSDLELDYDTACTWLEDVMESCGETEYTNDLLAAMKEIIKESSTFSEFFARLLHRWFGSSGLLLIDAADPALRKLESPFFTGVIKNADEITRKVLAQQELVAGEGYGKAIELEENAANLFYYEKEKQVRTLLSLDDKGRFISGKDEAFAFTTDEMLELAESRPECLSNNVVTRPIMQESLFPVLAFIAGPGEAAYWAELKQSFELFEMKMPPIVPRLNITLLERSVETDLKEVGMSIEDALSGRTKERLSGFLCQIKDETLEDLYARMLGGVEESHREFSARALKVDGALSPLLEKNLDIIKKQLQFIYDKTNERNKDKYKTVTSKYNRISCSLSPLDSPQERIWNPIYFLNKYGPDFIQELTELQYEFNNKHKVIML
ncbi:bacillithiol biosynthesis cysteine-adding enzyme BshC [Peribacillus sp. SCS-37]|uniref:bacillithiol biosynthesis cysteine-adding enzyme BshC n=1 Tax=Paraperibacillus esterisolvens TaxID=3115296 RepID=UPI0039069E0A